MFFLVSVVVCVLVALVDRAFQLYTLGYLCALILLVPSLAMCVRRLHDAGHTGWWLIILLIPVLGLVVIMVFCAQGSREDDRFGPVP